MARKASLLVLALLGWLAASASGCAGSIKNMRAVDNINTVATPADSVLVFLRPSGIGYAGQSEVFEIREGQPARLVGIVAAKKKVAFRTTPGTHMFMVVGESADFMEARLAANQTYYALVTPRMGWWKARFSLRPLLPEENAKLPEWLEEAQWAELNEDSARWAAENSADIEAKRAKYMRAWMAKDPAERPVLAGPPAK